MRKVKLKVGDTVTYQIPEGWDTHYWSNVVSVEPVIGDVGVIVTLGEWVAVSWPRLGNNHSLPAMFLRRE